MLIPKALTIAGSDSGGGAGIQADLKTFSAFRVFGMSVITAVTAQNSLGVQGVENLRPPSSRFSCAPSSRLRRRRGQVWHAVDGAHHRGGGGDARRRSRRKLVVDPVMVAKSGAALLQPEARQALIDRVLPLALVVTRTSRGGVARGDPGGVAAGHGRGRAPHPSARAPLRARQGWASQGRRDRPALERQGVHGVPRPGSIRGTRMARAAPSRRRSRRARAGQALGDAIRDAKAYVTRAIREGFAAGRGVGQLRHFIAEW